MKILFQTLIELAIGDIFLFNGTYYKQIGSQAMGSPLSATLANVFLCHHKNNWIHNCLDDSKPIIEDKGMIPLLFLKTNIMPKIF